jgi:hypothetical protein
LAVDAGDRDEDLAMVWQKSSQHRLHHKMSAALKGQDYMLSFVTACDHEQS